MTRSAPPTVSVFLGRIVANVADPFLTHPEYKRVTVSSQVFFSLSSLIRTLSNSRVSDDRRLCFCLCSYAASFLLVVSRWHSRLAFGLSLPFFVRSSFLPVPFTHPHPTRSLLVSLPSLLLSFPSYSHSLSQRAHSLSSSTMSPHLPLICFREHMLLPPNFILHSLTHTLCSCSHYLLDSLAPPSPPSSSDTTRRGEARLFPRLFSSLSLFVVSVYCITLTLLLDISNRTSALPLDRTWPLDWTSVAGLWYSDDVKQRPILT
jgi:hypothetical protein